MKANATARPFVLVNMAMTADGKIATANRRVSSFGSPQDQHELYQLRATADAILCGARTVDTNKVLLGTGAERYRRLRLRRGLAEASLRIIASGTGTLDPNAEIFRHRFSPIIILASQRAPAAKLAALRRVADVVKVFGADTIDFRAALAWLCQEWNVKRLLCEGGGEINDALFRIGLVDELHLTVCPMVFGGRHAPTIAEGGGFAHLGGAFPLRLQSRRRVGDEMFLVYAAVCR